MKTLIVLLLCLSACSTWKTQDILREVAWQTVHVIDWGQTLEIARHPEDYHEINPIMGKHPSVGNVNVYMGLSSIGHLAVSYVLPPKIRPYWQYLTIVTSGACVINNFNIGLGVKF
jgi:hypothetical protein